MREVDFAITFVEVVSVTLLDPLELTLQIFDHRFAL